jgi:DNA-binding MarR family transcriptional regulator
MVSKSTKDPSAGDADTVFQLEAFLPHQMMITARRISRVLAMRYAQAFDLSVAELSVLNVIGRNGSLSPTIIAERTSLDKVRVSRASASLAARGMVRQNADPKDGRGRLLRLTRRGTTVHQQTADVLRGIEAMLTADLSRTEAAALTRILTKLNDRLDALDQDDTETE